MKFTIVEEATKVLVADGTNFKDPTEGKLVGTIVSGPPEERDDGVIRFGGKKLLPGVVRQGGFLKYEVGGQKFTAPIQAVKITLRSGKEYDLWVDSGAGVRLNREKSMVDLVELCPGETIFFVGQGGTEEQHERFLEILKETWLCIPAADRQTVFNYHRTLYRCEPRVGLCAPIKYPAPLAQAGPEGFMFSCDLLRIFDLPKRSWIMLVIAEELAHGYLQATKHPTHISDPPNDNEDSPERQAWRGAQEDAMQEVLFQWPFDPSEYAELLAWVKSKTV